MNDLSNTRTRTARIKSVLRGAKTVRDKAKVPVTLPGLNTREKEDARKDIGSSSNRD